MNSTEKGIIDISVVIPAYNEEKRIRKTVELVFDYFRSRNYRFEVVVVNDGSTDTTGRLVSEITGIYENLRLINCSTNRGKGRAVYEGMTASLGRLRLFMDADGSTSIEELDEMLPYFDRGFDIVFGSRGVKGTVITAHQPVIRETLGRYFNLYVRIITGLPFRDTQAGFKIFSAESCVSVFPYQTIWDWVFDVELLVIADSHGFRIHEHPITWRHSPNSRVSVIKSMFRAAADVLRIRFNYLTGKYGAR